MKSFYSTNKTSTATPPPPQKKKKKKKNKMKVSFYLEITKNSLAKCAKYETSAYCTGSFHILHIFAQVLYFAHFSRINVFSKGLLVFYLLQNINKFQRAEKKINYERRKEKMDGCLNEEHVKYTTWILSARHPYFV